MQLPPKLPKKQKRASRWKSQAHLTHVRKHACSACHSAVNIQAAHYRSGSGAGMGQKPDDWRTVSLCKPCHDEQHRQGEDTFWQGRDILGLIEAFIKSSPKRREIEAARNAQ